MNGSQHIFTVGSVKIFLKLQAIAQVPFRFFTIVFIGNEVI